MTPVVQSAGRIFEDPPAVNNAGNHCLQSANDINKDYDNDDYTNRTHRWIHNGHHAPSPLGERHINSPPQPKKIPLKDESSERPSMHKKTGSASSLKALLIGKERNTGVDRFMSHESRPSPKKMKSSTNLVGLLKKKSKKNLQDSTDSGRYEQESPSKSKIEPQKHDGPQSSRHAIIDVRGKTPAARTIEEEILMYTPKDYSEHDPIEQRSSRAYTDSTQQFIPPKPSFLRHKSSRSSIFTEELDDHERNQDLQHPRTCESRSKSAQSEHSSPQKASTKEILQVHQQKTNLKAKRTSKIFDTIAALNMKSRHEDPPNKLQEETIPLSPQELDSAMEKMLGRYDIPQNLRDQLRNLKPEVKAGLMKGDRIGSGSSDQSSQEYEYVRSRDEERPGSNGEDSKESKRSRSRSRTRSRILSISKRGETSPSKNETGSRSRSKTRPRSIDLGRSMNGKGLSSTTSLTNLNTPDSAVTPGDFIHYLKEVQKPELVEVGKIHKLRILLRNESVAWTDAFVKKGGMDEIVQLLYRIMTVEWREEHEDSLLHETLLCLKGLSTTKLAMQRLEVIGVELFPALLKMLFDPERKGPSEYNTRGIVIALVFSHLSATLHNKSDEHEQRARYVLTIIQDAKPLDDKQPLEFVSQMHTSRPYRTWCKEVTNVTKEVFWIFLHHMNVVPVGGPTNDNETEYAQAYFPSLRAPHPAAPYVGGVEWEATQYLALHLDLLNGLIVSLPTPEERNKLREELRQSGWEKVMGGSLRTCKEKFYGSVHDGLKSWVAAAKKDGWPVEDVRAGPPRDTLSPKKSPNKKKNTDEAPKIFLDVGAPAPTSSDVGWL